ncbi:MAG: sigma-70 family RNA polymerase sigma factor [Verrucomicrobia subdivision 3 bacterium]|nr:sigma-70 family RNA polymerase sigma factor [Limisphaerales bacterium]
MADTPAINDQQLARDAQDGSLDAFEELVRRHESRLFHFLCQKLPSREDAEDMAQKSLITAWQKLHLYRSEASFATWLYTIARRLVISHYRKHGKVTLCELEAAESVLVETDTPADEYHRTEEQATLWRVARETLKDEAYDMLWMRYRDQLSIAEIATALERTNTSVKVMLHRTRKTLARALEAEADAEVSATSANELKSLRTPMTILNPC